MEPFHAFFDLHGAFVRVFRSFSGFDEQVRVVSYCLADALYDAFREELDAHFDTDLDHYRSIAACRLVENKFGVGCGSFSFRGVFLLNDTSQVQ